MGNYCYINAVVGALQTVPRVRTAIQDDPDRVSEKFLGMLNDALKDPEELRSAFAASVGGSCFANMQQHDVAAFIESLLPQLSSASGDLANLFIFQRQETKIRDKCGHEITRSSPLWLLPIKVSERSTYVLQDEILNWTDVSDVDPYKCSACGGQEEECGRSRTVIQSFPPLMFIQLRRFYFEKATKTTVKSTAAVCGSEFIYVVEAGVRRWYRVKAIIHHFGETSDSGHYVVDTFNARLRQWSRRNDSHVQMFTCQDDSEYFMNQQLMKDCYFFLYEEVNLANL